MAQAMGNRGLRPEDKFNAQALVQRMKAMQPGGAGIGDTQFAVQRMQGRGKNRGYKNIGNFQNLSQQRAAGQQRQQQQQQRQPPQAPAPAPAPAPTSRQQKLQDLMTRVQQARPSMDNVVTPLDYQSTPYSAYRAPSGAGDLGGVEQGTRMEVAGGRPGVQARGNQANSYRSRTSRPLLEPTRPPLEPKGFGQSNFAAPTPFNMDTGVIGQVRAQNKKYQPRPAQPYSGPSFSRGFSRPAPAPSGSVDFKNDPDIKSILNKPMPKLNNLALSNFDQ